MHSDRLASLWDPFAVERAVPIPSRVDGQTYRVHLAHRDSAIASDMLATLNAKTIALMRALRDRYASAPGPRGATTRRLLARYNQDNLVENSPRSPPDDTAYTIDKGQLLAVCLRARDGSDEFVDENLLLFVVIHELAHIADAQVAHGPSFWITFRFLLQVAVACGIYVPVDYKLRPEMYCGLAVDYNPLFDRSLADLPP